MQFLVVFMSLLLSLCHHSTTAIHPAGALAFQPSNPSAGISFPDRRELARETGSTGYSETSCASCLRMNASYATR